MRRSEKPFPSTSARRRPALEPFLTNASGTTHVLLRYQPVPLLSHVLLRFRVRLIMFWTRSTSPSPSTSRRRTPVSAKVLLVKSTGMLHVLLAFVQPAPVFNQAFRV